MDQPTFLGTLFGDARTRTRLILVYAGLVGFNVVAWAWAFAFAFARRIRRSAGPSTLLPLSNPCCGML